MKIIVIIFQFLSIVVISFWTFGGMEINSRIIISLALLGVITVIVKIVENIRKNKMSFKNRIFIYIISVSIAYLILPSEWQTQKVYYRHMHFSRTIEIQQREGYLHKSELRFVDKLALFGPFYYVTDPDTIGIGIPWEAF